LQVFHQVARFAFAQLEKAERADDEMVASLIALGLVQHAECERFDDFHGGLT
jgi:hypothetical protein